MLNGKRILVVVPARGGSKGVKKKNIRSLVGIPLIGHTAMFARKLEMVDEIVLSTDCEEIAAVGEQWGLNSPFRRPAELAGDLVGDQPVLADALTKIEAIRKLTYDYIVMLQVTSPLRTIQDVSDAIRECIYNNLDSVWTISRAPLHLHPSKQFRLNGESLSYCTADGPSIIARQQLEPTYYRNGACYVMSRACIVDQKSTMGNRAGFVISTTRQISIDSFEDFTVAEEELERLGNLFIES